MRTPDGHGRLELTKFHTPTATSAEPDAPANMTRLGFALLLKFFELEGRFPRHLGELPRQAVEYMAQQVKWAAAEVNAASASATKLGRPGHSVPPANSAMTPVNLFGETV